MTVARRTSRGFMDMVYWFARCIDCLIATLLSTRNFVARSIEATPTYRLSHITISPPCNHSKLKTYCYRWPRPMHFQPEEMGEGVWGGARGTLTCGCVQ